MSLDEVQKTRSKRAPISVLMSTHSGADATHLRDALESVYDQTLPAAEVILVLDGTVPESQSEVIREIRARHVSPPLVTIPLAAKQGLASALNLGLQACTQELIARMDSDDLCDPRRFELQYEILRGAREVGLVASWHSEFRTGEPVVGGPLKCAPATHAQLQKRLKWRNTLSHPTIMFRADAARSVQGYSNQVGKLEDYDFYMKLFAAGVKFHVIEKPLVHVRGGTSQVSRRYRWRDTRDEWSLRYRCWRRGNLNLGEFLVTAAIWTIFRMIPAGIKIHLYKLVRRHSPI